MSSNSQKRDLDDFQVVYEKWRVLKEAFNEFPFLISIFRRSLLENELSKINPCSITGVNRSKEVKFRWQKKMNLRLNFWKLFSVKKITLYIILIKRIFEIYVFKKNQFSIISYIHKTPLLENSLKQIFKENFNFKNGFLEKSFITLLSSILLRTSIRKKDYELIIKSGMDVVFDPKKNTSNIANIEIRLIKSISIVKFFLRLLKVKLIITHDAHSHVGMIIAHAAKELNIKVIEVAHGYTQDESLLTIFPLFADYEIVWSDSVRDMINSKFANHFEEKFYLNKILSFSQPLKIYHEQSPITYSLRKNILVLIPSIKSFNEKEKKSTIKCFRKLIEQLNKNNFKVNVRPHPSDFEIVDKSSHFKILRGLSDFDLDPKTILRRYNIVIGAMSSLLFEAAIHKLYVFQISEYPGVIIEGANLVNFNNCLDMVLNRNNLDKHEIEDFRVNEFFSILKIHTLINQD